MTAGFKKFRSRASRINGAKKNGKSRLIVLSLAGWLQRNRKEWKQWIGLRLEKLEGIKVELSD